MSHFKLCEKCTVRSCKKKPIKKGRGYVCYKRRAYRGGFKFMELAIENSLTEVMTLVHEHGLQITESPKKGYRISRRKKYDKGA